MVAIELFYLNHILEASRFNEYVGLNIFLEWFWDEVTKKSCRFISWWRSVSLHGYNQKSLIHLLPQLIIGPKHDFWFQTGFLWKDLLRLFLYCVLHVGVNPIRPKLSLHRIFDVYRQDIFINKESSIVQRLCVWFNSF